MKIPFIFPSALKRLGVAGIGCCLGMSMAFATPEEDHAQGQREFQRGDLMSSMTFSRKAAQAGYAPSQAWMGDILDKAEEDVEAVTWYQKAADQGNADGEFGLGQMYMKGEGVKKDEEQGRRYTERAAAKNHVEAVKVMMSAYRQGSMGLPMDHAQADAWETKLIAILPGYIKPMPKNGSKATNGATK